MSNTDRFKAVIDGLTDRDNDNVTLQSMAMKFVTYNSGELTDPDNPDPQELAGLALTVIRNVSKQAVRMPAEDAVRTDVDSQAEAAGDAAVGDF